MSCQDLRRYLSGYLDDELEVAEILRLENHLAQCRGCRAVQEAQLGLWSAVRNPGLYFQPPAELASRVAAAVRLQAKNEARQESSWVDWFRMPSLRWVSATLVLVLTITAGTLLIINNLTCVHPISSSSRAPS
jgi:predicted anti-sigma-YlaC factor YlaD